MHRPRGVAARAAVAAQAIAVGVAAEAVKASVKMSTSVLPALGSNGQEEVGSVFFRKVTVHSMVLGSLSAKYA